MSVNTNNCVSGSAAGNNLGNLQGSYSVAPTYNSPGGTSVTPSFTRAGNVSSFSTGSGVNIGGVSASHPVTPATTVFGGAAVGSNGYKQVSAGARFKF